MDPLQTTFDVTLEGSKGTFTFRIPKVTFDMEVGYKSAEIRRNAYPAGGGVLTGLDDAAYAFSRYAAFMELYLESSTETWPFSKDAAGKPVVDSSKFPPTHIDAVYEVGAAFDTAYGRFRRTGNFNIASAGAETVASQPNPGAS